MTTLLGFIQLLLVFLPFGKQPHKTVFTEDKKVSTHAHEINKPIAIPSPLHSIPPFSNGLQASTTTTHNNKGIPSSPLARKKILFFNYTVGERLISNKPFHPCDLNILYCRLKSDC
jgi:hypothetical protein